MKIHILDDWFDTLRTLPCFEKLTGHAVTVWTDQAPDTDTLARRISDADVLVLFRERTRVTRDLIAQVPRLRLISQRGATPHIDMDACTDHGVLVCSNKGDGVPSRAAAELTWALILTAMRDLSVQMASAKAGQWQAGVGKSLYGRTLGLYGYGRIAPLVARYARAFGMDVICWGSEQGRARAAADGHRIPVSRTAFFTEPDIVSLHVRLTPETRGLITANDLSHMRPDSVLVNTSRAGLLAPGALHHALDLGRPGQAAIDVFDTEPLTDPQDPVLCHPRVIATPHIGFVTEDEFNTQFSDIFDQITAYADQSPIHMVNPQVWS